MNFNAKPEQPQTRVFSPFDRYSEYKAVIAGLDLIPVTWALTPLQDKRAYRDRWQSEKPLSRGELKKLIRSGEDKISSRGNHYRSYCSGYGLRTGEVSGGILTIDFDGITAGLLWDAIRENHPDPSELTISWTSGKEGRKQIALKIPEAYRSQLTGFNRAVLHQWGEVECTHTINEHGQKQYSEGLEFRYNNCQSALPPSRHPETGNYYWLNSPKDYEVLEAPIWLCELVCLLAASEQIKDEKQEQERLEKIAQRQQQREQNRLRGLTDLGDILEQSSDRLQGDIFNWSGHNFHHIKDRLEGCCPNHSSQSGRSFHVNLTTLEWYCFGCQVGGHAVDYRHFVNTGNIKPRGKDFVDLVRELAHEAGVDFPERTTNNRQLGEPDHEEYQEYLEWEREQELTTKLERVRSKESKERVRKERYQQKKREQEALKRARNQKLQELWSQNDSTDSFPLWTQDAIYQFLADRYRERLAWNTQIKEWYRYEVEQTGIWGKEHKEFVWQIILAELNHLADIYEEIDGKRPNYTASWVEGLEKFLKSALAVRKWDEKPNLLPMLNGVYDLATKELKPHAPGNRLTWCLPYGYNPLAGCEPIIEWLYKMNSHDPSIVQFHRAHLNAVIKGRTDIQTYLELVGPGGSGKSTLMRLATALVGDRNVVSTTLKNLEANRFDTARLFNARLVVVTDAEKFGGDVSVLKAITGEDKLRYEEKFKQPLDGFYAKCRVMVAANEIPQTSDYTSGLERRRQTVYMNNKIPVSQQLPLISINEQGISGLFADFIPGLLNWVLELSDSDVTRIIRETPLNNRDFVQYRAQVLTETNPLADWLDHAIVYREGYRTNVGVASRDKSPDSPTWFMGTNQWLYANYAEYCQNTGAKAVSLRRFVNLLHDLVNNQLHLNVEKLRDRYGSCFLGLKIRDEYDEDPLLITGAVTGCDGTVMDSVMVQTRTGDECDGFGGLGDLRGLENNPEIILPPAGEPEQLEPVLNELINKGGVEDKPSHSSPARLSAITEPSREPSQPSQVIEYDEVISHIDHHLSRLNWTKEDGKDYLIKTYGKKSRQLLSDDELIEFWEYLRNLSGAEQRG